MGKTSQKSAKYMINAKIEIAGIVEKSDVVGAIFGQTEGLLGDQLDLRELKEKGKIGRMNLDLKQTDGSTEASLELPSSLDATETALLAASLETIEKIGPSNADLTVNSIEDLRVSKRDYIVKRSKQLLQDIERETPDKKKLMNEIKQEVRKEELTDYHSFVAGPDVEWDDNIVIVEGKADVVNLLEKGVKNALAIGGTSVPSQIERIAEEKDLTAFLDGDRGGDLILRELKEKAEPEYVARAPEGKEVEELSKREVHSALRDREPVKYTEEPEVEQQISEEDVKAFSEKISELTGTRAVNTLDEDGEVVEKRPVSAVSELEKKCYAVIMDGTIDEAAVSKAEQLDAEYLVGKDRNETASSSEVILMTKEEL
ncbi:DNA primase DnaG [Candidatus Nanohalovita haloferacivicina]|uniref:DNA primase DnaG n=1 Tax=Candidatus Nanohalovita haloferacivicina TaxID=2978046 RepID=UPI00325FABC4|nr:DNA primase [Candidatus Nanohalobia archaeon BNXNv]